MSRAIITPELSETLRNLRLEHKIQAKQLAEHIHKSRAYISRLENHTLQTIDSEELLSILKYILGDSENNDSLLNEIYEILEFKYSKKDIKEQVWLTNYDTVDRSIPVPKDLVKELNDLSDSLGISREYLLTRINANEALTQAERDDPSIPFNIWHERKGSYHPLDCFIKIKLNINVLNGILDGTLDTSPYIVLFCIVFYILKIQKFDTQVSISEDAYSDLYNDAIDLLNKHKFYSIAEKRRLLSATNNEAEQKAFLSVFDIENRECLERINSQFQRISEYNIKLANKALASFANNLDSDIGFMMRIISLDFAHLDSLNVSNKKALLNEIEEMIKRYERLPAEKNTIETY